MRSCTIWALRWSASTFETPSRQPAVRQPYSPISWRIGTSTLVVGLSSLLHQNTCGCGDQSMGMRAHCSCLIVCACFAMKNVPSQVQRECFRVEDLRRGLGKDRTLVL